MFISNAYAQSAGAAGGQNSLMGMLPLVLMFVVLYFIMIRPQMKRQKETRSMLEALSNGDEVVTVGGIIGRIVKIDETYITLEASKGVELRLQRSAVVQVLPKGTVKAA